ncbi:MAG TPA: cytochrome c biogenesis protein CcdA [Anaerolineaceae bacterium]|nr:cytochrome c biogenesis protein CcdA [Anaerolineaceae bacterium]
MQPSSIAGYLLVFLGGLLTGVGPCNIAMIPLIVGYIGGSKDLPRRRAFWISLVFSIGMAVTFTLLGVIAALVGGLLGGGTRAWYYIVAVVCFIIGLQMLGVLRFSVPVWMEEMREKVKTRGLPGAFLLGLVSGLVVSQCATPVLAVILTFVMAQQSGVAYGAALLFLYALGCAVPVVLAGTFAGALKNLRAFGRWNELINKVGGALLILVGFYFLWVA